MQITEAAQKFNSPILKVVNGGMFIYILGYCGSTP